MSFEHVCVIGLGYVGLPTAAVIASRGIRVTGVDINPKTVGTINAGKTHIVEPDLDMIVHGAVSKGWLVAATEPVAADAFIIAVPTPFNDKREPDLSYMEAATKSIAPVLKKGDLVIVESTVPVGATERVRDWLARAREDLSFPDHSPNATDYDIRVAHSPERVLPGRVLLELVRNDRVIGGIGGQCAATAAALYEVFVDGTLHLSDARTAELVKLSENAYRDVNIAFANELANVAEPLGIEVRDVVELANFHPRVNILSPGPGVGGHCIAVDPWFIVAGAPERTPLIQAARSINDRRPEAVAKMIAASPAAKAGRAIACLGLSYKADIDDLRESPAIAVIHALRGLIENEILIVEPHTEQLPDALADLKGVELCDAHEALMKAGGVAVLTDHREFLALDTTKFESADIIDTRGIWRSVNRA